MSLETLPIGNFGHLMHASLADRDPRGVIWIKEPPDPRATYFMGVDPTKGITAWSRELRTRDDLRTDNGAIEIIKKGRDGEKDKQVCEYAGPLDPYDLAVLANALGRLFCGNNEDGQCLCIPEVWPGPGLPLLREMINRFGYTNIYIWRYVDKLTPKLTTSLGWYSNEKTVRDLWIRGTRHIIHERIELFSEPLIEEMTDCEEDPIKMMGKAIYGKHDDRVRALLMAIWAAHDWSLDVETVTTMETEPDNSPNWQASDVSVDEMGARWEDRFAALIED